MARKISEKQILEWVTTADLDTLLPVWNAVIERRETLQALQNAGIDLEVERGAAEADMVRSLRESGMLPQVPHPDDATSPTDFPNWEETPNIPTGMYVPHDMVELDGFVWEHQGVGVSGARPPGAPWVNVTYELFPALNPALRDPVEWEPGVRYETGQMVIFGDARYRVVEAHVSEGGLEPGVEGMEFLYEGVDDGGI